MKEEMLGNVQQNREADLEMWTNISGILHKAEKKKSPLSSVLSLV